LMINLLTLNMPKTYKKIWKEVRVN
jgi:hypothetical protein